LRAVAAASSGEIRPRSANRTTPRVPPPIFPVFAFARQVIGRTVRLLMKITKDTVVAIDYTLTNTKGEVIDSSVGFEPLKYLHGAQNIIPGLERELEGLVAGDEKTVTVQPEDGYGVREEALIVTVPRANIEAEAQVAVGMRFHAETPAGVRVMRVIAVEPETVTLDGNHELAGEVLNFKVKVATIRAAKPTEIEHGHPHQETSCGTGCGCHG
jgi:FKBP-type peptidyl-prolyl cis-trans isomerase SlyD